MLRGMSADWQRLTVREFLTNHRALARWWLQATVAFATLVFHRLDRSVPQAVVSRLPIHFSPGVRGLLATRRDATCLRQCPK